MRDRGTDQPHGAQQVGLHRAADPIVVDVESPARRRATGVGDNDVDLAEVFHRGGHQSLGHIGIGDVGHDAEDLGAGAQLLLGDVEGLGLAGVHHQPGPLGGQRLGTRSTQSSR